MHRREGYIAPRLRFRIRWDRIAWATGIGICWAVIACWMFMLATNF